MMSDLNSREDIYKAICRASRLNTLGLFVGSGFTKAVLENDMTYEAYSWAELLEKCCKSMNINEDMLKSTGSYPEIASKMCKQYSSDNDCNYSDAVAELKKIICELVSVFPNKKIQEKYFTNFDKLNANWIVTTNYDTVLESILLGKALPISPKDYFVKVADMIPIYHIHGIRSMPDSIVITNEDYACLFRPNDYRQARLPFLMKESLVVMLGYGLGDINVLTAVDWSNNVFTNTNENYDFPIIQLLRKTQPKDNPYIDESGLTILEIESLDKFLDDFNEYFPKYQENYDKVIQHISKHISIFNDCTNENINNFIQKECYRLEIINFVSSLSKEFSYIYNSYLSFLRAIISELNELSRPDGAFRAYDKKLIVILDILENVQLVKMPTSFFTYIADAFDSVAHYVGNNNGQSWSAYITWNNRKTKIPKDTVNELRRYCKSGSWGVRYHLLKLLDEIDYNTLNNR